MELWSCRATNPFRTATPSLPRWPKARAKFRITLRPPIAAARWNAYATWASKLRKRTARVRINGVGLHGFKEAARALDAENSGSTMRMLAGVLAGQPFNSTLTGDDSLRRRPMRRVIDPLRQMGAEIEAREGDRAPLEIRGGNLHAIDYTTPDPQRAGEIGDPAGGTISPMASPPCANRS